MKFVYFRVYEKLLFKHLLTDDLVVITIFFCANEKSISEHMVAHNSAIVFCICQSVFGVVFDVCRNGDCYDVINDSTFFFMGNGYASQMHGYTC